MKKKRKKKKPALRVQSPVMQEAEKISQHEDTVLKVTAQFFQDEIMPVLNIDGKVEAGEDIAKADLLPVVLSLLMGGQMSQRERVSTAYDITRRAMGVDAEVIRKVEAMIYVMADKFLDSVEME